LIKRRVRKMAKKAVNVKKEAVKKRITKAKSQLDKIPLDKPPGRGFIEFVREQGVVGLAIGFILGAQSRMLVDSIVNGFINPLIGLLLPGDGDLREREFSMTFREQTEQFSHGEFVFQLITFLAVAAVVYFIFKFLRLDRLDKKK
jgi:large conductance mechanosensitive channel protein